MESETVTDWLLLIGATLFAVGLALFDWRLLLLWFGVLFMAVGLARLRRS